MLLEEIFYSTFWISAISIIWFYTDWFIQYSQLLDIAEETQLKYFSYIIENPYGNFTDFLYEQSLLTSDKYTKFLYKLLSCPFCLLLWLSIFVSEMYGHIIIAAPVYVLSLVIVLQIKRMI